MINDEIRNQTQKMKDMTFSGKVSYIWEYYKWHILITILVLIALISFIVDRVTAKETVFYVTFINSSLTDPSKSTLMKDFSRTESSFDPKKEQMILDTGSFMNLAEPDAVTMAYDEKMAASYAVGFVDVTVADRDIIEKYGAVGAYANLDYLLDDDLKEQLEKLGFSLLYVESDPEVTEEQSVIPVGIFLKNSPRLKKGFTDGGSTLPFFDEALGHEPVFAVSVKSSHTGCAIDFLRFLMRE